MKMPLRRREETVSATIPATLWLIAGFSLVLVLGASASQPGWWTSSGAVTDTNNSTTNNSIAVNMGQVKQFTARAMGEMNTNLPGGAGSMLSNMVYTWQTNYAANGWNGTNPKPSDLQAANVGQLKYIGKQVWSQLVSAGYTNALPSWLAQTNAGDYAVANIGQLKTVFNFDPLGLPMPITGFTADYVSANEVDLSWAQPTVNTASSLLVQQSLDGGMTWTTIGTLAPSATSYNVTTTGAGIGPTFHVVAENTVGSTPSPSPTPSAPPIIPGDLSEALDTSDNMNVSWVASPGASTYMVERETITTATWATLGTVSDTTYSDAQYSPGIVPGGFRYRVTALNSTGNSAPSASYPSPKYAVIDLGVNMEAILVNNVGTVVLKQDIGNNIYTTIYWNLFRWINGDLQPLTTPSNQGVINTYNDPSFSFTDINCYNHSVDMDDNNNVIASVQTFSTNSTVNDALIWTPNSNAATVLKAGTFEYTYASPSSDFQIHSGWAYTVDNGTVYGGALTKVIAGSNAPLYNGVAWYSPTSQPTPIDSHSLVSQGANGFLYNGLETVTLQARNGHFITASGLAPSTNNLMGPNEFNDATGTFLWTEFRLLRSIIGDIT